MSCFTFASNVIKSQYITKITEFLTELGERTGEKNMLVTSFLRTPEKQASAMLDYPTEKMQALYKNHEQQHGYYKIREKYNNIKREQTKNRNAEVKSTDTKLYRELLAEMAKEIKKDEFDHVTGLTIDIAPSSIRNRPNFLTIVDKMMSDKKITKFLCPERGTRTEHAYHIKVSRSYSYKK